MTRRPSIAEGLFVTAWVCSSVALWMVGVHTNLTAAYVLSLLMNVATMWMYPLVAIGVGVLMIPVPDSPMAYAVHDAVSVALPSLAQAILLVALRRSWCARRLRQPSSPIS